MATPSTDSQQSIIATVPLKLRADSSFNEGNETFTFTATYTDANARVYTASCDVLIKDTSTFPAEISKLTYLNQANGITYTLVTLAVYQPQDMVPGDTLVCTFDVYSATDTNFTTPIRTSPVMPHEVPVNFSYFTSNIVFKHATDILIAQPHAAYKVKATITSTKYNTWIGFLDIPASGTAPTPPTPPSGTNVATVSYSGSSVIVGKAPPVTYTITNGIPNGYFYLELKDTNGGYTSPNPKMQLNSSGYYTSTITFTTSGVFTVRFNFVGGNVTSDYLITSSFPVEGVSIVETGPYIVGTKYTMRFTNTVPTTTFNITGNPSNATIPVTSGSPSDINITPTQEGNNKVSFSFAPTNNKTDLTFVAVAGGAALSLTQDPTWTAAGINEGTKLSISASTVNIPDQADINWVITKKTGNITPSDFSPPSLSGSVKNKRNSGEIKGACTIELTIANDSSFNEGEESFILTASYKGVTSTCEVKIYDSSTFPATFTRLDNTTDSITKITSSVLSLAMSAWPSTSASGDKFNYAIKTYSDVGLYSFVETLSTGTFTNGSTDMSTTVSIRQPHPDYYVHATITSANHNPFSRVLNVSAVIAQPITVVYSPDTTQTVGSNVTYTISNGPFYGYYFLETKVNGTYTRSDQRTLDNVGSGSGVFTANTAGKVTTRVNVISNNQQSPDHDTTFTYATETVSMVQQAPYYSGSTYTAQISNAQVGDKFTISDTLNAAVTPSSGTISTNNNTNVLTVKPTGTTGSYTSSFKVNFQKTQHTVNVSLPGGVISNELSYNANTLYGSVDGKSISEIIITLTNTTFYPGLVSNDTYVMFQNAPSWLSPVITRLSETQVKLTFLTKSPTAENLSNGFNNLNITFTDAAFNEVDAATVLNHNYSSVNVKFPSTVCFTTDSTWVVPTGVTELHIWAIGGGGGTSGYRARKDGADDMYFFPGGTGEKVINQVVTVTAQTTLHITIGNGGSVGTATGDSWKPTNLGSNTVVTTGVSTLINCLVGASPTNFKYAYGTHSTVSGEKGFLGRIDKLPSLSFWYYLDNNKYKPVLDSACFTLPSIFNIQEPYLYGGSEMNGIVAIAYQLP